MPPLWLVPATFVAHVAEEAPGFAGWVRRHGSPRYTGADFIRVNAAGLAMTIAATEALRRARGRTSVFLYLAFVLTQQALFNAIFHAGATLAYREYSPGLVTALAGFLPAWWHLTRLARAEELVSARASRAATAIAGAVHAAAVVATVYRR
jgi:hypothetical protein